MVTGRRRRRRRRRMPPLRWCGGGYWNTKKSPKNITGFTSPPPVGGEAGVWKWCYCLIAPAVAVVVVVEEEEEMNGVRTRGGR